MAGSGNMTGKTGGGLLPEEVNITGGLGLTNAAFGGVLLLDACGIDGGGAFVGTKLPSVGGAARTTIACRC